MPGSRPTGPAWQFGAAEERAIAALALAQDIQPDAQTYFAAQMFLVRYEQGRLEEVLPSILDHVADPDFAVPAVEAMTAFIYYELERLDDSRRYYSPLAADGFAGLRFDHVWLFGVACCAEVAVRLRDSESVAVLSDLMVPYSDQVVNVHGWPLNCVSHYRGLLAASLSRFDEAEAHFQATVDKQLRMGTPAWLAHTRFEWARMLLARRAPGDVEQAQEMLGQALATARELGLGNVERRAVALMQDCP